MRQYIGQSETGKPLYRYDSANDQDYIDDISAGRVRPSTPRVPSTSAIQPPERIDVSQMNQELDQLARPPTVQDSVGALAGQPAEEPMSWAGFGRNIREEAAGMGRGLLALPQVAAKFTPAYGLVQGIRRISDTRIPEPALEQAGILGAMGKGIVQDYVNLLTHPAKSFYTRPIGSTLDVLAVAAPAYKAIKARQAAQAAGAAIPAGAVAKAPDIAEEAARIGTKERMFASAFTIPTKRAKDLRPLETAKKMIDYGVQGNLDELDDVARAVTGSNGIITQVTRDAVGQIPIEIDITDAPKAVKTLGQTLTEVTPDDITKVRLQITMKIPSGTAPTTINAVDAYDLAKQLERQAADLTRRSTYLTPNLRYEQLGKLYNAAADEIVDSIGKAVKDADIVSAVKTPETINAISEISPKLAQEFLAAKTWSDIRHLASPFVRLSKMIDLTLDAQLSAAAKLGTSLGTRLGAGVVGYGFGGLPAAALGAAFAPVVEPLLQKVTYGLGPKIATSVAGRMAQMAPVTGAIGAGVRTLGEAVRNAMLIRGIRAGEQPMQPPPRQVEPTGEPSSQLPQDLEDALIQLGGNYAE